jgi:putative endonuclease
MRGFVYVLISSKDKNRYIGSTSTIDLRLRQHNAGKVVSTKNRRPLKLEYVQVFDNIIDARIAESKYKKSRGVYERAVKQGLLKEFGV